MAKRRGFGLPEADHRERAADEYRDTSHFAQEARLATKQFRCRTALKELMSAQDAYGRGRAHDESAGKQRIGAGPKDDLRMATNLFDKVCLRPSGDARPLKRAFKGR